jgi:hypothetical protein
MSTKPSEIYTNAQALPQKSESEIRTKISRLYYALFSHACEFDASLPDQGVLLNKESGVHSRLSQRLTNPTVKSAALQDASRTIGSFQRLAHEIRVKADYHLNDNVTTADLAKCTRFVEKGMSVNITEVKEELPAAAVATISITRVK